ncbi:hypothetical protein Nps_00475 [Candidatus Nanopusillus acidilobi]|nr:hypothetical protein Nps_00475 [Candidatus Nanopusillus acidilobi]
MRNQLETVYVVLFLTIAILIILLSFYALTYNYNQNIVFNRFTSLSTLSNYFLGYLQTALTQEGYVESYIAGTNGWGEEEWASYPYGCILPQSCQNAIQYYNNLLTSGFETLLSFGEQYLSAYQYYYPYNISFNFSNNYQAGILGDCSDIASGEYNYSFPVYVQGLYINITGPSSGSIIPYSVTSNITNNPAFYLYNLAYQFSQNGEFSECSYQDCSNTLNNNPTYTCAQEFEQFSNNPYIQCNETIIPYQCINIPLCQICSNPQGIACKVILKCSDNQYNVYYNGNTYPQTITITSIVFYENITNQYYLNCTYNCIETYNLTSNQIISQSCTLENQQYSCSPLQNECGSVSTTQQNSEEIFAFQYYYSIQVNCYTCIIGGHQCPACLPGECPYQCPATISFPSECIQQNTQQQ